MRPTTEEDLQGVQSKISQMALCYDLSWVWKSCPCYHSSSRCEQKSHQRLRDKLAKCETRKIFRRFDWLFRSHRQILSHVLHVSVNFGNVRIITDYFHVEIHNRVQQSSYQRYHRGRLLFVYYHGFYSRHRNRERAFEEVKRAQSYGSGTIYSVSLTTETRRRQENIA